MFAARFVLIVAARWIEMRSAQLPEGISTDGLQSAIVPSTTSPDRAPLMLTTAPWLTDGSYPFGYIDHIYSMLLDNPGDFYMTPDEQVVVIYLRRRGLVRFIHDFRGMNDEQINQTINNMMGGRRG